MKNEMSKQKKWILFCLCALIILAMVVFFLVAQRGRRDVSVVQSHTQDADDWEQEPVPVFCPTYTLGEITFEIEPGWETLNMGGGRSAKVNPDQLLFCTKNMKVLYGLLGTTELGDRHPEEFFEGMKAFYAETNEILESDNSPQPWTSPDGTACLVGTIKMVDNKQIYYVITIFMAPEHNLAATFFGHSNLEDQKQVNPEKMWQTAVFKKGGN